MTKFPEPDTKRLIATKSDVRSLAKGSRWWRVYFADGRHAGGWNTFRNFGPVPSARFDHHYEPPCEQERRVLYAGSSVGVCIAEVFQDRRRVSFEGTPRLVSFELAREIKVLDLVGLWPTRAGGSQAIASGPRSRSQRWARMIADTFDDLDGMIYRSSMHGGDEALVLWDCPDALAGVADLDLGLHEPRMAQPLHRLGASIGYSVAIA